MYDGTWAMQHLMTHIQQHTHTAKFAVRKLYDRNNTKKNRVGGNSKKHICSSSFNHSIAHTHTQAQTHEHVLVGILIQNDESKRKRKRKSRKCKRA